MYQLSCNRPLTTEQKTTDSSANDKFLTIVWHELRNSTAAILGWAELLGQTSFDSERFPHGIETIRRNAQLQAQLIDHLLDFARIRMDDFRLDAQRITVLATLKGALETMMPQALAKGIRIEALLDPASGWIIGDTFRLQQVFTNLLSNAIKFTPAGGYIRVLLLGNETSVQVKVSDTGKGINAELLPHIFDGVQAPQDSATEPRGLGLGLEISRRLIERHGGRINAFSNGKGLGATFTVHLPRADAVVNR